MKVFFLSLHLVGLISNVLNREKTRRANMIKEIINFLSQL